MLMPDDLFLSNTIHEIRTPVQTIIGTLELLSDTELDNEQTEYLRQLRFSADVLLSLINNILDLSKIRSGKISLENIPFDVATLTEQTVYLISIEAFNKKLEVVTDIDDSLPEFVMGDPTRVQQIILNIIKNALKFTDRGYIHVELRKKDERTLLFRFTDSGIGITKENRERLFRDYYQGDASTSRKYGGTGLGLAICKGLVEAMGGGIGVRPNPYGGSVFYFTLPLVPAANPGRPLPDLPFPATTHILIVDDSPLAADSLAARLNSLGLHYIRKTDDGEDVLLRMKYAAAIGDPFDIVFIDMLLPVSDGWELASRIKNDPAVSGAKLYLLVPEGQMGSRAKMKRMNWFSGYLYKPVRSVKLAALLAQTNGAARPVIPSDDEDEKRRRAQKNGEDQSVAAGIKILVADDHPINRRILVTFLQKYGAEVLEAEDGDQACDQIARNPGVQIVFMDIRMPGTDGIEATARLRKRKFAGTIIACTANDDRRDFGKYIKTGMNDLLIKPFKKEAVKSLIEKWRAVIDLPAAQDITRLDAGIAMDEALWDSADFEDTIGGDTELGRQLLFDYTDQTKEMIQKAKEAADGEDFAELRNIGHTLKGSSAAISAHRLADAGAKISAAARNSDAAAARTGIAEFGEQFERFLLAAEKWRRIES